MQEKVAFQSYRVEDHVQVSKGQNSNAASLPTRMLRMVIGALLPGTGPLRLRLEQDFPCAPCGDALSSFSRGPELLRFLLFFFQG